MNDHDLVDAINQSAYRLCMRLINDPSLVDESLIPHILDHASLLQRAAQRLLSEGRVGGRAFVRTPSLGIVWMEIVDGGFYVFLVDGSPVNLDEIPQQDRDTITSAYRTHAENYL